MAAPQYASTNSDSENLNPDAYDLGQLPAARQFSIGSQSRSANVSEISKSVIEVNVPEARNLKAEFVYNFYVKNERIDGASVTSPKSSRRLDNDQIARYIVVNWQSPTLSSFEKNVAVYEKRLDEKRFSIKSNARKIISEDNFFNTGYVNHTFSNFDAIERGASDLEAFSFLAKDESESVYKMARARIRTKSSINTDLIDSDSYYREQLADIAESYLTLADFPNSSLGLVVTDKSGKELDDNDFFRGLTKSLSLTMKINAAIIPDIFDNSREKLQENNLQNLKQYYSRSLSSNAVGETLDVESIDDEGVESVKSIYPIKLLGYIVERYRYSRDDQSFKREKTWHLEDIGITSLQDPEIVYGASYFYSIRAVAAVKVNASDKDGNLKSSTLYVSSRATTTSVETFEYVPPPPPDSLKFIFDYSKKNVTIHWETPLNSQLDIKQFQVMRRKSIEEPFELIALYNFDDSMIGSNDTARYTTGEIVDINNPDMPEEYKYLTKVTDHPVNSHVDVDFNVDYDTYVSSRYIYAVCSVDAHGMISNYSTQFRVEFDTRANKLKSSIVCDAGCPRQYPNMYLRKDTFKDSFILSGEKSKKLNLYFTPESFEVSDRSSRTYPVVFAKATGRAQTNFAARNTTESAKNGYYLLQLINLDNQKMQTLKIDIEDPQNLTL